MRLDSIALGFLLSIYFSKLVNFKKTIMILTMILIAAYINYKTLFFNNTSINTVYFIFLSQASSVLLVLLFCNIEFLISNNIVKKVCNTVAAQTYSVYLFHLIIMHFLIMLNLKLINNLFVYICILFIISTVIFKYFEKPILALRPKYKNG